MLDLHTDRLDEAHHFHGDEARRFHLLSYLVSNAAAAELLAMENRAGMVPLLPSTRARIDMVDAAEVAGEHVLLLGALGRDLGIGVGRALVEPCWHALRAHVRSAVDSKDLAACLVLQDVIAGSLAATIYDTLASTGYLHSRAVTVTMRLLADAFERLEAGTWQVRTLLSQDPESTVDALRWAHHRAMPELQGRTGAGCAEFCAVSAGACEPTAVDHIAHDIEMLKRRSTQRYAETLISLLDPAVVRPLLAGLSGYGARLSVVEGVQAGLGAASQGQTG